MIRQKFFCQLDNVVVIRAGQSLIRSHTDDCPAQSPLLLPLLAVIQIGMVEALRQMAHNTGEHILQSVEIGLGGCQGPPGVIHFRR